MRQNDNGSLREFGGGRIMQRKDTGVPGLLKFVFPLVGAACAGYLLVSGLDGGASRQGVLYAVAGVLVVYVIVLAVFAMRQSPEE